MRNRTPLWALLALTLLGIAAVVWLAATEPPRCDAVIDPDRPCVIKTTPEYGQTPTPEARDA